MAESVGEALVPLGIATLSIDLPLHGERADPFELRSVRNPFELAARWRTAIEEARLALRFLSARREIDRERLGVIGYSLGSYLSLAVAERNGAPRAFVLAAGGDLPDFPLAQLIRSVADPLRGVRALRWPSPAHGSRQAGSHRFPGASRASLLCGGRAEGDPVVGRRSLPPGRRCP